MMESELFFCTLVLLGFGIAVFVLLLCQGLCSPPAAGVYILPVGIQPDMEYRLWLAESQVQLGRCGGVLLVEAGGSEETHKICTLFMRRRPWVRCCTPEALDAGVWEGVCKSGGGVLY